MIPFFFFPSVLLHSQQMQKETAIPIMSIKHPHFGGSWFKLPAETHGAALSDRYGLNVQWGQTQKRDKNYHTRKNDKK